MVAASKRRTIFHPGCMRISNGAALQNRPEKATSKIDQGYFHGIRVV
jgi:hypothetical protein